MRTRAAWVALTAVWAMTAGDARGADGCSPADFAKAIDSAGVTLRAYNLETAPKLQAKLAELARKKNWREEEREQKTREFLDDDRIPTLDATASELLAKIDALGRPPEKTAPDCAKLDDLKAASVELLAVMKTKSTYTLEKIAGELGASAKSPPPPGKVAAAPAPAEPKAPPAKAPVAKKEAAPPPPREPARKEAKREAGSATEPATGASSWSTTSELAPSAERDPRSAEDAPPFADPAQPGFPYPPSEEGYTIDEIREVTRGFFGTISTSLASVIEYAFSQSGRPSAYVLGSEGGGAFLAGVRYGSGKLFLHRGADSKVYWTGPSLGGDFGAEASRTMFLIYHLHEPDGLFRRFTGVDGSAYLVGGVGITFLKGGDVLMAPIRSGLGLRIGANIGYIRFTSEPSWNPF